jgi:hypothetical protein
VLDQLPVRDLQRLARAAELHHEQDQEVAPPRRTLASMAEGIAAVQMPSGEWSGRTLGPAFGRRRLRRQSHLPW